MNTEWSPEVPPEIRQATEPLLHQAAFAIPPWVQYLHVRFDRENPNTASITVDESSLRLTLFIGPGLLEWTPPDRLVCICHEIAHAYTSAAVHGAREAYRAHLPEGPARTYAEQMATATLERATEYLGRLLASLAATPQ